MIVLLAFAFLSGTITILSPCILPILPVVLAGGTANGKARPIGIIAGFIASFTFFTLAMTSIVALTGLSPDVLRIVAAIVILSLGLVLVVPPLHDWFGAFGSRLAGIVGKMGRNSRRAAPVYTGFEGFVSGLLVGSSIGLVWTPCVGPIMASVISLALTRKIDGGAILITLAYAAGTSIPMFAIMAGGRKLVEKVPFLVKSSAKIQKAFGIVMMVVAIAIGAGWDRQFQSFVLRILPSYGEGLTAIENGSGVAQELGNRKLMISDTVGNNKPFSYSSMPENGITSDYGIAPEFVTKGNWFNTKDFAATDGKPVQGSSPALSMDGLRGKVVLVDFWTYSCINCIRTLPFLKKWYENYKDKGLVIIGVHTPEFEFEKSQSNVAKAIKDLGVTWPVVQDNDYEQWKSYSNTYWPAHYFVDKNGHVRYFHFGEGRYAESERVIRSLLGETGSPMSGSALSDPRIDTGTGETYLGYARGAGLVSGDTLVTAGVTDYKTARLPLNGEWTLMGKWTIDKEYSVPEPDGTLSLGFDARKVSLVASPEGTGGTIIVKVDGSIRSDTQDVKSGVLVPGEPRLYRLVELENRGKHVLTLEVTGRIRLYSFTFG